MEKSIKCLKRKSKYGRKRINRIHHKMNNLKKIKAATWYTRDRIRFTRRRKSASTCSQASRMKNMKSNWMGTSPKSSSKQTNSILKAERVRCRIKTNRSTGSATKGCQIRVCSLAAKTKSESSCRVKIKPRGPTCLNKRNQEN